MLNPVDVANAVSAGRFVYAYNLGLDAIANADNNQQGLIDQTAGLVLLGRIHFEFRDFERSQLLLKTAYDLCPDASRSALHIEWVAAMAGWSSTLESRQTALRQPTISPLVGSQAATWLHIIKDHDPEVVERFAASDQLADLASEVLVAAVRAIRTYSINGENTRCVLSRHHVQRVEDQTNMILEEWKRRAGLVRRYDYLLGFARLETGMYFQLATLFLEQGRYDRAAEAFRAFEKSDPQFTKRHIAGHAVRIQLAAALGVPLSTRNATMEAAIKRLDREGFRFVKGRPFPIEEYDGSTAVDSTQPGWSEAIDAIEERIVSATVQIPQDQVPSTIRRLRSLSPRHLTHAEATGHLRELGAAANTYVDPQHSIELLDQALTVQKEGTYSTKEAHPEVERITAFHCLQRMRVLVRLNRREEALATATQVLTLARLEHLVPLLGNTASPQVDGEPGLGEFHRDPPSDTPWPSPHQVKLVVEALGKGGLGRDHEHHIEEVRAANHERHSGPHQAEDHDEEHRVNRRAAFSRQMAVLAVADTLRAVGRSDLAVAWYVALTRLNPSLGVAWARRISLETALGLGRHGLSELDQVEAGTSILVSSRFIVEVERSRALLDQGRIDAAERQFAALCSQLSPCPSNLTAKRSNLLRPVDGVAPLDPDCEEQKLVHVLSGIRTTYDETTAAWCGRIDVARRNRSLEGARAVANEADRALARWEAGAFGCFSANLVTAETGDAGASSDGDGNDPELSQGWADVLLALAWAEIQLGDPRRGVDLALRGIRTFPYSLTGWMAVARGLRLLGRHADAFDALRLLLGEGQPDTVPSWFREMNGSQFVIPNMLLHHQTKLATEMGWCAIDVDRPDIAETYFRDAVERAPYYTQAHRGLVNVARYYGQDRPDVQPFIATAEAIEAQAEQSLGVLEAVLGEGSSASRDVRLEAARALLRIRHKDRAEQYLREVKRDVRSAGRSPDTWLRLFLAIADAYLDAGYVRDAEATQRLIKRTDADTRRGRRGGTGRRDGFDHDKYLMLTIRIALAKGRPTEALGKLSRHVKDRTSLGAAVSEPIRLAHAVAAFESRDFNKARHLIHQHDDNYGIDPDVPKSDLRRLINGWILLATSEVPALHHFHRLCCIAEAETLLKRTDAESVDERHLGAIVEARRASTQAQASQAGGYGAMLEIVRRRPFEASLRRDLAAVQATVGDLDEALETLQGALYLDPSDARAHLLRGWIRFQQGDLGQAARRFRKAVEFDATDYVHHRAYAMALMQLGDYQQALHTIERGLASVPRQRRPRLFLLKAAVLTARSETLDRRSRRVDLELAREALEQAEEESSNPLELAELRVQQTYLQLRTGRWSGTTARIHRTKAEELLRQADTEDDVRWERSSTSHQQLSQAIEALEAENKKLRHLDRDRAAIYRPSNKPEVMEDRPESERYSAQYDSWSKRKLALEAIQQNARHENPLVHSHQTGPNHPAYQTGADGDRSGDDKTLRPLFCKVARQGDNRGTASHLSTTQAARDVERLKHHVSMSFLDSNNQAMAVRRFLALVALPILMAGGALALYPGDQISNPSVTVDKLLVVAGVLLLVYLLVPMVGSITSLSVRGVSIELDADRLVEEIVHTDIDLSASRLLRMSGFSNHRPTVPFDDVEPRLIEPLASRSLGG